jgi:hypothetical protein
MAAVTADADSHFASSYAAARHNFRSAAAGSMVIERRNDAAGLGPAGEPLSCDVARFGPRGAAHVLVVLSGVHGKEGYAGSAVQSAWMRAGGPRRVAPDCAVVLVHAVNPWGFAYGSRTTEGNVDLNRNFIDFSRPPPANPDYDAVHPIFSTTDATPESLDRAIAALDATRGTMGAKAYANAMGRGQYRHPDGLMYGGMAPTWSNRVLREILGEQLAGAQSAAMVDLHTGIGAYGATVFMCFHPPGSAAWTRARAWWGERAVDGSTLPPEHKVLADYGGTTLDAFADAAAGRAGVTMAVEFGTLGRLEMRRALLIDRWLSLNGDRTSAKARALVDATVAASAPADPAWRAQVIAGGVAVIDQAVAGLGREAPGGFAASA